MAGTPTSILLLKEEVLLAIAFISYTNDLVLLEKKNTDREI